MTYFEMCHARTWAMYILKSHVDTRLVLNVTDVDKTSRWFLTNDIPQKYGLVNLDPWFGQQKENTIEYTNGDTPTSTLHILAFTHSAFPSSLYISLYNMTTGARFAPLCLVIWNRARPDFTNQGHAQGRCPEYI